MRYSGHISVSKYILLLFVSKQKEKKTNLYVYIYSYSFYIVVKRRKRTPWMSLHILENFGGTLRLWPPRVMRLWRQILKLQSIIIVGPLTPKQPPLSPLSPRGRGKFRVSIFYMYHGVSWGQQALFLRATVMAGPNSCYLLKVIIIDNY